MKQSGIEELPDHMILERWCQTTVADLIGAHNLQEGSNIGACPLLQYNRSCALNVLASSIICNASQSVEGYTLALRKLQKLKVGIEALRDLEEDGEGRLEEETGSENNDNVIRDPRPSKSKKGKSRQTKGRKGKSGIEERRCSHCREVGHD